MWHFTSPVHWQFIAEDGRIDTTDSVIFPDGRPSPKVVWLTNDPSPSVQQWSSSPMLEALYDVNKTMLRIAIDQDKLQGHQLHQWWDWSLERGMEGWWRDALIEAGGGEEAARHWYVYVASRIKWSAWMEVIQTTNGEIIWTPEAGHPKRHKIFMLDRG